MTATARHFLAAERYTSADELLRVCNTRAVNAAWSNGRSRSSREVRGDDWAGCKDWGGAVSKARAGCPEYVRAMRDACGRAGKLVAGEVREYRQVTAWGVCGDAPSVARALTGAARCYSRTTRECVTRRGLRLVFDCSTSCDNKGARLIETGGRAVALVDALSAAGVPCALDAAWSAIDDAAEATALRLEVIRAGRRACLATVAFWIAHPAALRRIAFAWMETVPGLRGGWRSYGAVARPFVMQRYGWEDDLTAALTDGGAARLLRVEDLATDSDVPRLFRELTGVR